MKLESVLDNLNSFEKNSFLKIIDGILSENPKNLKEIESILSSTERGLKNADSVIISQVFQLVEKEFIGFLKNEFLKTSSQLDILTDILIRDGNCIMKLDWFARLYEKELKSIRKKVKELQKSFEDPKSNTPEERKRDYKIYKACVETAFFNDDNYDSDRKITREELSILVRLSKELELSQEEIKLINYIIVPIETRNIEEVIDELRASGVILYSKKSNTIYIADEIVKVLRDIRGKEVADKYFRRVLRLLKNADVNRICKKHNIDWRLPHEQKMKEIISEGISFSTAISIDIHKPDTSLTEKKTFLNDLWEKGLKMNSRLKGSTLEEKLETLIEYFHSLEKDEKVSISVNGYEKLLRDLEQSIPRVNKIVKGEFELQEENVLSSKYLLDFNIKPRDVLEVLGPKEIDAFCTKKEISTRGDSILNILDEYKDSENIFIENFENFGYRRLSELKENGINIKESDIGLKFEELTKLIFRKLGFNVDEDLRKKLNTAKDKMDVLINLGNQNLILIECKTVKEKGYNKFSSVSRQLKSYGKLAKKEGYTVIKSLLIAPEFSEDFKSECDLEYELNLSLIEAKTLMGILAAFKEAKLETFPYKLLMRDVLIQEERVVKAILK